VRDLVRSIADALDKIPKAAPETAAEIQRTSDESAADTAAAARFENL
jgi:hypothetical protein